MLRIIIGGRWSSWLLYLLANLLLAVVSHFLTVLKLEFSMPRSPDFLRFTSGAWSYLLVHLDSNHVSGLFGLAVGTRINQTLPAKCTKNLGTITLLNVYSDINTVFCVAWNLTTVIFISSHFCCSWRSENIQSWDHLFKIYPRKLTLWNHFHLI